MKIKKIIQKIFKTFFQFFFKLIYGKVTYQKDNLISPNICIKEIQSEDLINFFKKKYKVYKIKKGRIYTDNVENVSIIDNNNILDNISYQQILGNLVGTNQNVSLYKGTPRIKKKFKGRVLSLAQGASGHSNYYHWLYDLLPKLKLYSEIYKFKDINHLYVSGLKSWQIATLVPIGLDKINIIDTKKNRHIQGDEIICTDHPSYYSGYIKEESKNIPEWIVKWLRETFLQCEKKFLCNDRVFIDRSSSSINHCQFINDEEVSEFLINKSFTKYKVEQLSFFEQIYLFSHANFIIGAHGAAFANLAFCKKGAKIIEIQPKNYKDLNYKRISDINNLDYHLINTNIVENSTMSIGDMNLDVKELDKFFR